MSLIASLRSSKLQARKKMLLADSDANLPLAERVNQFILEKGDVYLLPFLDKADILKVQCGKWPPPSHCSQQGLEPPGWLARPLQINSNQHCNRQLRNATSS